MRKEILYNIGVVTLAVAAFCCNNATESISSQSIPVALLRNQCESAPFLFCGSQDLLLEEDSVVSVEYVQYRSPNGVFHFSLPLRWRFDGGDSLQYVFKDDLQPDNKIVITVNKLHEGFENANDYLKLLRESLESDFDSEFKNIEFGKPSSRSEGLLAMSISLKEKTIYIIASEEDEFILEITMINKRADTVRALKEFNLFVFSFRVKGRSLMNIDDLNLRQ